MITVMMIVGVTTNTTNYNNDNDDTNNNDNGYDDSRRLRQYQLAACGRRAALPTQRLKWAEKSTLII